MRSRIESAVTVAMRVLGGLWLSACTAEDYARRADEAAAREIGAYTERALGGRAEWVEYPDPAPVDGDGVAAIATSDAAGPAPREISLTEALAIAVKNNRDFLAQREGLISSALTLVQAGFDFTPQLRASIGYALRGGELFTETLPDKPARTQDANVAFGVTQRFPLGGQLSLDLGTGLARTNDALAIDRSAYSSNLAVNFSQPLLRGFGYEVGSDSLIQAERSMLYAIREFELFRQGFTIDVAQRFYNLVQQKESIGNVQANLDGFVFGRRQAEALFAVGRTNELDVLRARRSELTSQNALIEAKQGYKLGLDQFKTFLGLDPSEPIDVRPEAPEFVPIAYDVESSVAVARHNRLDLLNRRDQLEDTRRGLRIARNALLPDLDLDLGYAVGAGPGRTLRDQGTNADSYSLAVNLELPLNRMSERNSYRRAQIGLVQDERALELFEDQLEIDVTNSFRELERRKQSLDIQRQLIVDQEKNAKIAQIRFEQGEFSNRDVVEAQQALLDAQNTLIQERVSYEIARLQLLRDLGILFIDEQGRWQE